MRKHKVSATMFFEVDKHGNIDRKHNVFAPVFPVVEGCLGRKRNVMSSREGFHVSLELFSPTVFEPSLSQNPLLKLSCFVLADHRRWTMEVPNPCTIR